MLFKKSSQFLGREAESTYYHKLKTKKIKWVQKYFNFLLKFNLILFIYLKYILPLKKILANKRERLRTNTKGPTKENEQERS
jgi:hypothetical protein